MLSTYSLTWLDRIIGLCGVCSVAAYAFYTLDARTVALHGTGRMIVTVPVVAYGIGRYLWTLYRHGGGADPAAQIWCDPHLFWTLAVWLALVGWLIA